MRTEKQRRDRRKRGNHFSSVKQREIRQYLIDKYNNICQYCYIETNIKDVVMVNGNQQPGPMYPTIEHIIPAAKTKDWRKSNLTLACYSCNVKRGDDGGSY